MWHTAMSLHAVDWTRAVLTLALALQEDDEELRQPLGARSGWV